MFDCALPLLFAFLVYCTISWAHFERQTVAKSATVQLLVSTAAAAENSKQLRLTVAAAAVAVTGIEVLSLRCSTTDYCLASRVDRVTVHKSATVHCCDLIMVVAVMMRIEVVPRRGQ